LKGRELVLWELNIRGDWLSSAFGEGVCASRFILSKGWLITVTLYHFHYIVFAIAKLFPNVYHDVWIYDNIDKAFSALALWDVARIPEPPGWYRHPSTGRRREYDRKTGEMIREWFQP